MLSVEPLRTRILANFGVGFNHIDVEAARARGVAVSNTPDVLTDATADLAMTLLLMVARRTGEGERHVRSGQWTGWRPTHMLGTQVSGKTLGLIGMGRIARAVAQRAHHGFGMRVIFHDPYPPPADVAASLGAEPRARLEQVLKEADFVSLHCPGDPRDAPSDEPGSAGAHAFAMPASSTRRAGMWWMRRRWSRRSRREGSPAPDWTYSRGSRR